MTTESAPAISVVIPVYNRADTIGPCLDSIAAQTLPPTEVLLVDDGSTDGTRAAIEQWISRQTGATAYRYLHQPNQGKSAALNTGVAAASGEWIAFNDSDDFWLPEKLKRQFEALRSEPDALLCFSDSSFINDPTLNQTNFEIRGFDERSLPGRRLKEPYVTLAENPNGIFMQSIIARRSCIESVFPLDPNLRVGQDIDLIFRLSLTTDFCFCREPLVQIDRTPERGIGLTKQHDMKSLFRLQTKERIFKGWLEIDSEKVRRVSHLLRRHLSGVQRRIGSHYKKAGQSGEARRYFAASFGTCRSATAFAWLIIGSLPLGRKR